MNYGYIYFIQPKKNNDGNKGIKIGMTDNFKRRLRDPNYRDCIVIQVNYVSNYKSAEKDLKDLFIANFPVLDGKETFIIEDIGKGLNLFNQIVKKYIINHEQLEETFSKETKTAKSKAMSEFKSSERSEKSEHIEQSERSEKSECIEQSKQSESNESDESNEQSESSESDEIREEIKTEINDFSKDDKDIIINDNGKITFIYGNKPCLTHQDIKDKEFIFITTKGVRLHENKLYIYKPNTKHGWYYVGKRSNAILFNQIITSDSEEFEIKIKERHKKGNVYELFNS